MVQTIITVAITSLTSAIIGYLLSLIKSFRKRETAQNQALMTLLQNSLTNTYFKHEKDKQILDYVYRNWINELHAYEGLGGDDYVHVLAKKMEEFEIIRTDILDKH